MEKHALRDRSLPQRLPFREVTLLPIQPIDCLALEQIAEELRSRGVVVQLERSILRPRGSYDARRRQFKAEILLERVARSGARPVLGVTDSDCYAGKLNFVFGMADVGGGTALVSLCRLRAGATAGLFLARAMKEIIHELGHARGLGHCASSRCVMHFSNSLAETDAKDEQLCAACVQRLRK
jgi:archaemetzincin